MKICLKNIYLGHAQCDLKLVFDSLASVKFLTHDVLIGVWKHNKEAHVNPG